MKEAKIDILMQQNRMVKLIKSKFPTWVTEQKDEGIELVAGKFNVFRITKEGERDYNITCNQHVQKVLDALVEKPEQKTEQVPATAGAVLESGKFVNQISNVLAGKQILVPQNLEELKQMTTFDRILLFQKTAPGLVEKRRGWLLPSSAGKDKKALTDSDFKMLSYVEGNVMKLEADMAFLFEWSVVVEEMHWFPDQVVCRGYIEVEINGKKYRKPGAGAGVKKENAMMDWGDVAETAITEMVKRCLKNLGFNRDVYRGEV